MSQVKAEGVAKREGDTETDLEGEPDVEGDLEGEPDTEAERVPEREGDAEAPADGAPSDKEVEAAGDDLIALIEGPGSRYLFSKQLLNQSLGDYCRSDSFVLQLCRHLRDVMGDPLYAAEAERMVRLMRHRWFRDACGGTEPVVYFLAATISTSKTVGNGITVRDIATALTPTTRSEELRALDTVINDITTHIPHWPSESPAEDLDILHRLYSRSQGYTSSTVLAWLTSPADDSSPIEKTLPRALHVPRVRFVLRELLSRGEKGKRELAEQLLNPFPEKPTPGCTRLQTVTVENIFGFAFHKVVLDRFNLFVGENGSGKSNVLRAISFVLHHFPSVQYWHNHHCWTPDQHSRLLLQFELGKEDREILIDCFVLVVSEHLMLSSKRHGLSYFQETKNWLLRSPHMRDLIVGFDSAPLNNQQLVPIAYFNYFNKWATLTETHNGHYTFDQRWVQDIGSPSRLNILGELMWAVPRDGIQVRSVENAKRLPRTDVIASARRWPDLFSTGEEKPLHLVDIVQKIIRDRVVLLTENRGMLQLEGPHVNSMSISTVSQFVRRLQNGTRKQKLLLGKINAELRQLAGVQISYVDDPSVSFNLTYRQGDEEEERGIDNLHLGALDLLMVLCTLHYDQASICVLDEPTRSVHPSGRGLVRDHLLYTAEHESKTILAITHESEMVTELTLPHTLRCVRNGPKNSDPGKTTILPPISQGEEQQQARKFLAGPEIRGILFAKGVVFVEGGTDRRFMLALKYAMDWKKLGGEMANKYLVWDVVPVGGKDSLSVAASVAKSLRIPFVCLCDFDALIPNDCEEQTKQHKVNELERKVKELNGEIEQRDQRIKDLTDTSQRFDSARRTLLQFLQSWREDEAKWEADEREMIEKTMQQEASGEQSQPALEVIFKQLREKRMAVKEKATLEKRDTQLEKLRNLSEEQQDAANAWSNCKSAGELADLLLAQEEEAKRRAKDKGKEKQDASQDKGGKKRESTRLSHDSVFTDYQAAIRHYGTYSATWAKRSRSRGLAVLQAACGSEKSPALTDLYISDECPQSVEEWDGRVRDICAAFRKYDVFSWTIDIEHMVIWSEARNNEDASRRLSEEEEGQQEKESGKKHKGKKHKGKGQRQQGSHQLAALLKASWKTLSLNEIADRVVSLCQEENQELMLWIEFLTEKGAIQTSDLTGQASLP